MWYSLQRTLTHGMSTSQTHTQPMWYSPQWTLTHGTSTSQTHISHVVQSAADSHARDEYITDTHSPCGTVRSGLSRMGQVHDRHTQPMWYSPQRTLTHGTSTSQTHTSHVVQSAADSHAWDEYITDTHSPCGTVRSGLSRMRQVHHRHTHIPCGTVRNGLSRMGQVHHRHTHIPCGTVRSGLSRMGQVHDRHTQPMWYSPQRTLTHGMSTLLTHTAHVVQSAVDSHAWDKYITDTHIPCGTVRSGLSRMG